MHTVVHRCVSQHIIQSVLYMHSTITADWIATTLDNILPGGWEHNYNTHVLDLNTALYSCVGIRLSIQGSVQLEVSAQEMSSHGALHNLTLYKCVSRMMWSARFLDSMPAWH